MASEMESVPVEDRMRDDGSPESPGADPEEEDTSVAFPVVRRRTAFGLAFFFLINFLFHLLFVPPSASFLPWVFPALMGVLSLNFFRRALDTRPGLVLTPGGIEDRTSTVGGKLFIPWDEVRGIEISRTRQTLEVEVRDMLRIRENTDWPRRIWMLLGRVFGKKTVSIDPALFGLKKEELKEQVDEAQFEHERSALGFPPRVNRLGDGEPPPSNG